MASDPLPPGVAAGSSAPHSLLALLTDPANAGLDLDLSTVMLKGGERLFAAGDPGDALYVVVHGRLRALLPDRPPGEQVLGEIGRGESVGEMALLTGEPRSAEVRAVRDTKLLKLSKAGFERLAVRQPQLMLELAKLVITRYQKVLRPSERAQPVTLALVPCAAGVPIGAFSRDLHAALAKDRRVLSLDAERLTLELRSTTDRPFDPENAEVAGWLHDRELEHEIVIYVADAAPSAWTRLAVRQADLLLFVGESGASAGMAAGWLDDIGASNRSLSARRELVLLYRSDRALPTGTHEWLARLPVSAHHHVDLTESRDYARLARILTGRSYGLVLGGGGARGLAHIGVLRAIEEADIPIDLVGGTSSGSIIGGLVASRWSSARIQAECRRLLIEGGSLNDYTLPFFALIRGQRYIQMLEKLYGDRRIEDLPLGFFCVSTNLTQSTAVVHRSGLLHRRVAASCAVPGLGPPIVDGRDLLVDGGVVNNLPVDVMRGLGTGRVLASSVSPQAGLGLARELAVFPSPWRVLLSRLNPFSTDEPLPTIGSILIRTVSLQQSLVEDVADLVIEPAGDHWKLLDWRALDRIVESGYRSAKPAIEEWKRRTDGSAV